MSHYNQLSPETLEALSLLAEECAETIQVISKIQRHGLFSSHPERPTVTNQQLLQKELGHVSLAVDVLLSLRVIESEPIEESRNHKRETIQQWLHHVQVVNPRMFGKVEQLTEQMRESIEQAERGDVTDLNRGDFGG